ncbi:MAG: hypothetical protein AB7L90_21180 [Hyphomicrobiaceae bacterium]
MIGTRPAARRILRDTHRFSFGEPAGGRWRAEGAAALDRLARFETKYDRRIGLALLAVVVMVVFGALR